MPEKPNSPFYSVFDLSTARLNRSKKTPASHQHMALGKLHEWFQDSQKNSGAGGIVVLPTGGGKTYTAAHFLCSEPLSHGYKVLWLAHTHHLLEQAFDSFAPRDESVWPEQGVEVGCVAEPKASLSLRVVSGTPGHFPVSEVKGTEDVLIITLQTLARAWERREGLPGLSAFFKSAGQKLFVVFDEAHHAPAPGYRRLINDMRVHHRQMFLLGLTATPTYADVRKRGWLKKLFPQDILYEVSARKLMAEGILAKPIFERTKTDITPTFSQRDFQKWVGTFGDLPEDVIDNLANNRERNTLIAETYVNGRAKYGKTIIFAERWSQCEFLSEQLKKRGVEAGAVYSHVDATAGTATARNKHDKGENARVLENFKKGKLDVIINVRMLTEGTDVPSVNSVFLTRETTSQILLTQMVGRALRGPKFGGTETAYIVSFNDNWQHHINFADYRQLEDGGAEEANKEYGKRPPLQLISIELVRSLSRQMDTGITVAHGSFLSLMPVGWYRVEFDVLVAGTEDVEVSRDLIMVFEDNQKAFEKFIVHLANANLSAFANETLDLEPESVQATLDSWLDKFFDDASTRDPDEAKRSLADIARHMAQNEGQAPDFFPYAERVLHDLDAIVCELDTKRLTLREAQEALFIEYQRKDRFWPTFYNGFERFKSQADACLNRLLIGSSGAIVATIPVTRNTPESIPDREASDEIKEQVKRRDGYRCRCCGESSKSV